MANHWTLSSKNFEIPKERSMLISVGSMSKSPSSAKQINGFIELHIFVLMSTQNKLEKLINGSVIFEIVYSFLTLSVMSIRSRRSLTNNSPDLTLLTLHEISSIVSTSFDIFCFTVKDSHSCATYGDNRAITASCCFKCGFPKMACNCPAPTDDDEHLSTVSTSLSKSA